MNPPLIPEEISSPFHFSHKVATYVDSDKQTHQIFTLLIHFLIFLPSIEGDSKSILEAINLSLRKVAESLIQQETGILIGDLHLSNLSMLIEKHAFLTKCILCDVLACLGVKKFLLNDWQVYHIVP